MIRAILKLLKWILTTVCVLILALVLLVGYFYLRPNRSVVDDALVIESYPAVADGYHNSNTDMIYHNDAFYLIHARAPYHFASEKTKLVLLKSDDAREWEEIAEFQNPGEDIRDPKFAVIDGKIFMYALKSREFVAEPYSTELFVSDDGKVWGPLTDIDPEGWLFWRPKTMDGKTWYCPAYWHEHGKSMLLKSSDGYKWEKVSDIYEGDVNDETAIEFLPDGRMIATARLEVAGYYFGDNRGNTLIAVSDPPYEEWTYNHSYLSRLDGPYLFKYNGRVYAVGRYQPNKSGMLGETGSILARKRTSIYAVEEERLVWLSDLPSAGDTSYPGVVILEDKLYVCYYTSNIKRDYPWIMGMFAPSDIMMAEIDMNSVEALADEKM